MKSKHSITLWILVLVILTGAWIGRNVFKIMIPPSREMQALRRVENGLNFPWADRRTERDRGCYTDGKGAKQYERYIFFDYKKLATVEKVLEQLKNSSWKLHDKRDSKFNESHTTSYWYENEFEKGIRIYIGTQSGTINTYPHTMIISEGGREKCGR